MEKYLRFRRPSRTLYTKSWNARSTGGRFGRCVSVFGCDGTICNLTAPLFLSSIKFSLTQSPSTIFTVFKFLSTEFLKIGWFYRFASYSIPHWIIVCLLDGICAQIVDQNHCPVLITQYFICYRAHFWLQGTLKFNLFWSIHYFIPNMNREWVPVLKLVSGLPFDTLCFVVFAH